MNQGMVENKTPALGVPGLFPICFSRLFKTTEFYSCIFIDTGVALFNGQCALFAIGRHDYAQSDRCVLIYTIKPNFILAKECFVNRVFFRIYGFIFTLLNLQLLAQIFKFPLAVFFRLY